MKLADLRVEDMRPLGREAFTFPYRGRALSAGSARLAAWHREREEFHSAEADRLEIEVRGKGLELRERQVTGGVQFDAVLDPQVGAALADHRQRRDSHRQSAERFEAYAAAFDGDPERSYHLTIDDVHYFALHRVPS